MFGLVKLLKIDNKKVEGGRGMRGSDGNLCFSEKESSKVWRIIWKGSRMKEMIEIIMWMKML